MAQFAICKKSKCMKRLHRRSSGGADDYTIFSMPGGHCFIASAEFVEEEGGIWADELFTDLVAEYTQGDGSQLALGDTVTTEAEIQEEPPSSVATPLIKAFSAYQIAASAQSTPTMEELNRVIDTGFQDLQSDSLQQERC